MDSYSTDTAGRVAQKYQVNVVTVNFETITVNYFLFDQVPDYWTL